MDCRLPGSSVCGILQARILEWVAMHSSRGFSQPKDQTQVSPIVGGFFIIYLCHQGSPRILEWVDYPFSRGSSWPRDQTRVSCIADGFFTNWATRESLWIVYFAWFPLSCLSFSFYKKLYIIYKFGNFLQNFPKLIVCLSIFIKIFSYTGIFVFLLCGRSTSIFCYGMLFVSYIIVFLALECMPSGLLSFFPFFKCWNSLWYMVWDRDYF